MTIMKFEDDNDAVAIVNSCDYGLGSSVFSKDTARAERIAHRLITGMSNVNDFAVNYLCQSLPFGGVKVCVPFIYKNKAKDRERERERERERREKRERKQKCADEDNKETSRRRIE